MKGEQLSLATMAAVGPPDDPLVKAFWAFHRENPGVYLELRTMALELRRWGRRGRAQRLQN